MCGICGVIGIESNEQAEATARRMMDALRHRGPDEDGLLVAPSVALGMRRLSIIDVSGGRQPVFNEAGNVAVVFNGEIYNYQQLRATLEGRGHAFRTHSDTEVIVHAYEEWDEECLRELRGMFAFALWDARASGTSGDGARHARVFIARDRLGIKPLYYHRSGNELIFASEIRALLASCVVPRQLDPAGLRVFLQLGHIPPPWTAIRGVIPLEPGHFGVWHDGEWRTEAYWTLGRDASATPPPEPLAANLAEVLIDATRNHLISDVPVLMFLSGGTDSACLGALARAAGVQNLSAMTVGFGEAEFDESKLTRRTAEALGIPLEVVTLEARRVEADLDHSIWALDEPSVDGLNSYWISKLGAEAGFKVALSGQGGDELFGGYESLAWFERFNTVARWARPFSAISFGRLLDQNSFPFRWRKLSYLIGADDPFVAAQLAVKVLFLDRDVGELMSPSFSRNGRNTEARDHLTYWSKQVENEDLRERLAFMDIHTHLEPRLLRDLDAMSMAHSIEVRPVFLDHRVVEFLLPIPSSIRMQQKQLLLDAAKAFLPPDLLADLATRRKRTFTFPFQRWLSHDLRNVLREAFAPDRLRQTRILQPAAVNQLWDRYERSEGAIGWSRIWNLFVLQRWCELMQVSP
jgi:asparagine synthase (glutamine-hydrolysing)